jgi:ubiquinone/menaquinone biosynthesis C-methylase UbiE
VIPYSGTMADEATALDILASQKRYYDMRADRESEWLGSSGDWDYGVEQNLAWERERDAIAQRLESSVGPAIRLLEIAAGTGGWSSTIALQGAGLAIVTDTSERALALNPGVRRGETIKVLADAFCLPFRPACFDRIVIAQWLSHVPLVRVLPFLGSVAALLREGGHLFVVDAVKTTDNDYAERVVSARFGAVEHEQMRPVGGTNHRVVKTYHTQDSLVDAASRAALRLEEFQSGAFFFSAQLTPISTGSRST